MLGESILFSLFTNCLHRADKCGLGVRHDEDEIREQSSGGKFSDRDLHALRYREGMGKRAFPPQGVGTPVFLASELKALQKVGIQRRPGRTAQVCRGHQTRQALAGIMGWPVLQPKARPNSGIFCTTPLTRKRRGEWGSVWT